jgi:hypothetical protein
VSNKRKCSETKKDGTPCQAYALGEKYPPEIADKCSGHAGRGRDKLLALSAEARQKSIRVRQERAERRKQGLLDRMAVKVEEKAEEIVNAYLKAGLREGEWRALDSLVNRVYGKPVERVENVDTSKPELTMEELEDLRSRLLELYPDLKERYRERPLRVVNGE